MRAADLEPGHVPTLPEVRLLPRRTERYWMTTFGHWVSGYGVPALVRDLGVAGEPIHFNTVYRWLAGTVYVRPSIALKIVELSKDKLSLRDIYHHRKELAELDAAPLRSAS